MNLIKKSGQYIPSVAVLLLVAAFVFSGSINTDSNPIPYNEDVISPVEELRPPQHNVLADRTNGHSEKIETLVNNWDDLFDLFTYNPAQKNDQLAISSQELSVLKEKVWNAPQFKIGSEAALIEQYGDLIKKECNYYKLDWRLVLAMIRQESYFKSDAVSHAGAYGLMQLMPKTGASMQSMLSLDDTQTPKNNLIAGIYYFASLVAQFNSTGEDRYQFALAAYNAGFGRVIDAMTIAAYNEKDYYKWENVKEFYPYLAADQDSVHALVWPTSKKPSYGALNNWREPYKYVENIMFYYNQYVQHYPSNLPDEKKVAKKKKKKK